MLEKIIGLIMILTVGPYLILWDHHKDSSGNSGHTSGIGDGFLIIISYGVIAVHIILVCMLAIAYFYLGKTL